MVFLILFVVVPLVEFAVALLVAHAIGGWLTLGLLVLLSCFGFWQVKIQGMGAWYRLRSSEYSSEGPARTILDGALRLFGSVLLVIPGFVTAFFGGLLLIGFSRRFVAGHVGAAVVTKFAGPYGAAATVGHAGYKRYTRRRNGEVVVDVEGWEDPAAPDAPPALREAPSERNRPGGHA